MKSLFSCLVLNLLFITGLSAQDSLPADQTYARVPDMTGPYTAGKVAARMVDGLGFRYYWATEGLREEDLNYRPNPEARTTKQTLDHIYGLTNLILNAALEKENTGDEASPVTFEDIRDKTLENIRQTREHLAVATDTDMEKFKVIFRNTEGSSEFPFWNLVNGPIADAIWHTGQVASFRRSSGNPINPKVSFFTGTLRE